MTIKRVQCKRDCDNDWVTMHGRCILCDDKTSEWWDIEDAQEIYITLSNEPHAGAYKVRIESCLLEINKIEIEAENGEGVYEYVIFPKLYTELRRFNPTCYMGIEII
ncbi:MAG: hypothetical protein GY829_09270 [Gammaproteobacteria bacterium]|nr:hypothetical protein [Gammaproteobacteria bacterium]